ncbi:MAG TPA: cytochrome P450 [Acidimicrobiales bacterium]|nr:cytochrome P450 [Acidimicrobiales bacterium]
MRTPQGLDIDLMDGAFYGGDPYPAFAWLREHDPVHFDEHNGLWGVATYELVRSVSTDPDTFSNAGGSRPCVAPVPMMIDFDAPEHVRRRRLVSAGFTPRRVRELEDRVRGVCDWVIDQVCERGSCDFVSDVAAPLPLIVIGDMLGVAPEDRADVLAWSDDLLRGQGTDDPVVLETMMQAFVHYADYIRPIIEDRRRTGRQDDLVGVLVHAEIDGDRLDETSVVHETLLILIGGDETTRHVISGGMAELQRHPEQRAQLLSSPVGVPRAVEEMLRWVTPIQTMARTATRDVELAGRQIEAGQEVVLLYPSANRDEAVFERADRFDVTRDPNPHVAFGFGPHFCLGNQLARLELKVMFEQLLARLPDLRVVEGAPLPRRQASFVTGIETMPVVFSPTERVGAAAP